MNNLAKEINYLLMNDETVNEYLKLKKEINSDPNLVELKARLDFIRKEQCSKKKGEFTPEYDELLNRYLSDPRVDRYKKIQREIYEYFKEIGDILSLK